MTKRGRLILGLMRIEDMSVESLHDLLLFCLEKGITTLDVADIYSDGRSESALGEVFRRHPGLREKFFLQTKVGIIQKDGKTVCYDFSKDYLLKAVDNCLSRLCVDHVDSLLLHRPDILMDGKEVGEAVSSLLEKKKIFHFGVSNMDRSQIEYLEEFLPCPIEVDQLQLGLGQSFLLSGPLNVDNPVRSPLETGGLFFFLKRRGIALQCWSPYQVGFFEGSLFLHPKMEKAQECLADLSKKYGVSPCAVATAFLSSLGENVEIVIGALRKDYIQESLDGIALPLEREDWYRLYCSAGNVLP